MRKRNDLRMTLRSQDCDATGGSWKRKKMIRFFCSVLNLGMTAHSWRNILRAVCEVGLEGLGREAMPELEGYSVEATLETVSRQGVNL